VKQLSTLSRATLEAQLALSGLCLRGGFKPAEGDDLPVQPDGRPAAVLWLVGQVGSECWPAFSASGFYRDGRADPMDRWSKSIGDALAGACGGRALYPSDGPPFHPFQRWGQRAEPLRTSPLLLLLHPAYGLWHAYRFALALPELLPDDARDIAAQAGRLAPDLCLQCDGRPCLGACPVGAFGDDGFARDRCAAHLQGPEADSCLPTGCLARRACPVGAPHRYVPEHAAFHMAAFAHPG